MKQLSNTDAIFTKLRNFQGHRNKVLPREIGTSPFAIEPPADAVETSAIWHSYGSDGYSVETSQSNARQGDLIWIDIAGLKDHSRIAEIANSIGLSDFAIADLFHVDQRAHTDTDGDLVTTVLRMPISGPPFEAEQITLVLGPTFVLTVRDGPTDCFDSVRKRLAAGSGRIRSSSQYLFYALIDAIVDNYFPILERYGDLVDDLEERILLAPADDAMPDIHALKRELLVLRRTLWPLREALAALQRDDTPQVDGWLLPYLRDCTDHAFQLLDMVEVFRETAQGLVDLQLSSLSNRMNDVMKVLTMISTIFIPMTFIAGLYGMNFDRTSPFNLPELGWRFGYLFAICLMVSSAVLMILLFFRLGWIGSKSKREPTPAPNRTEKHE